MIQIIGPIISITEKTSRRKRNLEKKFAVSQTHFKTMLVLKNYLIAVQENIFIRSTLKQLETSLTTCGKIQKLKEYKFNKIRIIVEPGQKGAPEQIVGIVKRSRLTALLKTFKNKFKSDDGPFFSDPAFCVIPITVILLGPPPLPYPK
jgi:hypothetical protein